MAALNDSLAQFFPRGLKLAMEQLPLPEYNFLIWGMLLLSGFVVFCLALSYHPKQVGLGSKRRNKEKAEDSRGAPAATAEKSRHRD